MNEFDLIRRLQHLIGAGRTGLSQPGSIGIGDDAAVLTVDPGRQLVVTTDTLVAGVHFPPNALPADIGHKALAVNLSDLAAMGADPAWFFLALTLPHADVAWLDEFAAGVGALATACGIELAGGDTTSGPLSITITALGLVNPGAALLRSTAHAGDLVVISGTPGLAALGLAQLRAHEKADDAAWRALTRPEPRLDLGRVLRGKATACIDISDGLSADLAHIAQASQLGAEVWLERLPRPEVMRALPPEHCWNLQLGGGDDYELCFSLPAALQHELPAMAAESGVGLTVIGRLTSEPGLRFLRGDGSGFVPQRSGYNHFPDRAAQP
jgi:thiamine-monophosphate kinase